MKLKIYFKQAREKVLKDINLKKDDNLDKELNLEIQKSRN